MKDMCQTRLLGSLTSNCHVKTFLLPGLFYEHTVCFSMLKPLIAPVTIIGCHFDLTKVRVALAVDMTEVKIALLSDCDLLHHTTKHVISPQLHLQMTFSVSSSSINVASSV